MGFMISAPDGRTLRVNAWNWRPTLQLLADHGVLDGETVELLGYNGATRVSAQQSERIARFLDAYVAALPIDSRVMLDGSVTAEPDTGEFYRKAEEMHLNYSVQREWLVEFRDFCRSSEAGFSVG